MKIRTHFVVFIVLAILLISNSCDSKRQITEGQYLLRRNQVETTNTEIRKAQIRPFIRQQSNRRLLGLLPLNLFVYQLADRGRDTGIKRWFKNTIGEPPVIFNPILMESTRQQISMFLHGQGYFNSQVTAVFNPDLGLAKFQITGNRPYFVRNISYRIDDNNLATFVFADTAQSYIRINTQYSAEALESERQRISDNLRNKGFYRFSRDFIRFELDSALSMHKLDIAVVIENPVVDARPGASETRENYHRRYIIDRISIFPDFSPLTVPTGVFDTTYFTLDEALLTRPLEFIHSGKLTLKPKALAQQILLEPGSFFNSRDVELTYYNLSAMRNFRFINIQFADIPSVSGDTTDTAYGRLGADIQLVGLPANAFVIEAVGLNTAGMLGIAGNLSFSNRNFFGGAERLSMRLIGALEASASAFNNRETSPSPFNTLELGAELRLEIPRLLAPVSVGRLTGNTRPRTSINTGINYRHRPDYTRYIFNVSYGFEWSNNPQIRHLLHPLEISSIRIFNDSILLSRLPQDNPLILSRYKDHLTAGLRYSFVFNTQQIGRDVDFRYLRLNLETSGGLTNLIANVLDSPTDEDGKKTLFNIPYAQFIKADVDFRHYTFFNPNNSLVFRLMGGIGLPYGNSTVMPFVKSFFSGGANSIRAWRLYTLGPGSFSDTLGMRFDRYGDIKLEANIEHRFAIYRFLHGAVFADAGNVWFINENPQFKGGEFGLDTFLSEMAIGTGVGLRLDFNFFVVRLDAAFPLHNPALAPGERWLTSFPRLNQWNLNLGIGYPF